MANLRSKIAPIVAAFIVCVCLGCATSTANTDQDVKKAVAQAVSTYKALGMQGTAAEVTDCYGKSRGTGFYCVYLDLASRHIDQIFVSTFNFPPTEFYQDAAFGSRLGPVFAKANLSMDQSNAWLRLNTPIVNQRVDDAILQGSPRKAEPDNP